MNPKTELWQHRALDWSHLTYIIKNAPAQQSHAAILMRFCILHDTGYHPKTLRPGGVSYEIFFVGSRSIRQRGQTSSESLGVRIALTSYFQVGVLDGRRCLYTNIASCIKCANQFSFSHNIDGLSSAFKSVNWFFLEQIRLRSAHNQGANGTSRGRDFTKTNFLHQSRSIFTYHANRHKL